MAPPIHRPRRRPHLLGLPTLGHLLLLSTLVFSNSTAALPQPQDDDTPGNVDINAAPTDTPEDANLPITATLFRGAEGPSACRGGPMTVLTLPPPGARHAAELCYDLPGPAQCGVFVAAQADGCEVRLFSEDGCTRESFVNTHVFVPDARPVGGRWRSMAVRCGVTPPSEEELGSPPLAGMITSQKGH